MCPDPKVVQTRRAERRSSEIGSGQVSGEFADIVHDLREKLGLSDDAAFQEILTADPRKCMANVERAGMEAMGALGRDLIMIPDRYARLNAEFVTLSKDTLVLLERHEQ